MDEVKFDRVDLSRPAWRMEAWERYLTKVIEPPRSVRRGGGWLTMRARGARR